MNFSPVFFPVSGLPTFAFIRNFPSDIRDWYFFCARSLMRNATGGVGWIEFCARVGTPQRRKIVIESLNITRTTWLAICPAAFHFAILDPSLFQRHTFLVSHGINQHVKFEIHSAFRLKIPGILGHSAAYFPGISYKSSYNFSYSRNF